MKNLVSMRHTLFLMPLLAIFIAACDGPEPVTSERYAANDRLVAQIEENLAAQSHLAPVAMIDHTRLGEKAGSTMPPATVFIFSNPQLESELIALNPLAALELPQRVLVYEDAVTGVNKVISNSFDYLRARYQLDPGATAMLRQQYDQDMQDVTSGLPASARATFGTDEISSEGIVTIQSPYDFAETINRVNAAIDSQDDTMHFGIVDFQANARKLGMEIQPTYLILFGGPGPGGKAMAEAPTLGLDGFCQKFLIWQDAAGGVYLSFNNLLALADRQGVKTSLPLRVINFRLEKVFKEALANDQG